MAKAQGVSMEPGDALVLYGGREKFSAANPDWRMESLRSPTPGFDASCLAFIRDHDIAAVVWDMLDAGPNQYGVPWAVHGAIFAYGIALVDNALVEPLATACAEEGRYEFMLSVRTHPDRRWYRVARQPDGALLSVTGPLMTPVLGRFVR